MPDIPVRMGALDQALTARGGGLQAAIGGGRAADSAAGFERLFREHSRAILGYAMRRVEHSDQAADVLSEVMMVTWRRLADVPPGDDARLWLYGVARRVIANQSRSQDRRGRLGARLRADLQGVASDNVADTYETRDLVRSALAEVPDADRELILLSVWEGLEPTEIATVLGLAPGTVRTRLHRARARLRDLLADMGLDTEETT